MFDLLGGDLRDALSRELEIMKEAATTGSLDVRPLPSLTALLPHCPALPHCPSLPLPIPSPYGCCPPQALVEVHEEEQWQVPAATSASALPSPSVPTFQPPVRAPCAPSHPPAAAYAGAGPRHSPAAGARCLPAGLCCQGITSD